MTAYLGHPRTTLGQLCRRPAGLPITASYDPAWNQSRVSVVTPQAPRRSSLARCATREPLQSMKAFFEISPHIILSLQRHTFIVVKKKNLYRDYCAFVVQRPVSHE